MPALSQERGGDDPFEHPAKTPAFPWRCRMSDLDLAAFNHNRHNHHIPPGCAVQNVRHGLSFRTQMMCWQCCRWIVSKWFFHLLAFSFLILHCVALVLVADNATDQPDMWRSSSLRNVLSLVLSAFVVVIIFFLHLCWQDMSLLLRYLQFFLVSRRSSPKIGIYFKSTKIEVPMQFCCVQFWIPMCSYMKVEAISINVILNYDVTYVTYIVNQSVNPINNVDFLQLQATGASFFRVFRRYHHFTLFKHEVLRHFPGLFCFLPGGVLCSAHWRTRLGLLALQLVLVRSTAGASLCGRGKGKSPFFIRLLRWEIISLDHRISHNKYKSGSILNVN